MKKVAYVAGPYRADTIHGVVENIRSAEAVAIELWKMGYAVICPHKNTALLDGVCGDEVWLEGAIELMLRSDIVVLVPGWDKSEGTKAEAFKAMEDGMPVYKWPDHEQELRELDKGGMERYVGENIS